jgi:O-antigen ligase
MNFYKKYSWLTFENYLQLLVLCIPIFLISGPFFPDFFLTISSLSFIFFVFLKKKMHLFYNKTFLYFLIFLFICIISSLFSDYREKSLITSLGYIRFGIFIIVIKFLVNKKNNFVKNLYYLLFVIFILFFFDSILQKISGFNIFGWQAPYSRITSFFQHDIKLGGYILRFTPLLVALAIYNKKKINIIILITILSLIITFLSGERTAFFLNLFFFIAFFFIASLKKVAKFFLVLSTIIFLSVIVSVDTTLKFRLYENLVNQLNFLNKEPLYSEVVDHNGVSRSVHRDSTIVPRVYIMYLETSIQIWNDNIYLGSGPRTYQFKSSEPKYFRQSDHAGYLAYRDKINRAIEEIQKANRPEFKNKIDELAWKKGLGYIDGNFDGFTNISGANSHPHHIYLQLLSETGILGFFIIIGLFIFCFLKIFTKIQIYYKCIILSIVINLFPFTLSGNYFNNWLSILFFFPIGFLYIKNTNKI